MQRNLTTAGVAAELGLSPSAVQKYARDGHIPFETTPGGHRRYSLEEVWRALYPPKPALEPLELHGSLGAGASVTLSQAARLQHDVRSTVALATEADGPRSEDALTELFGHARRVLVSASS